MYIYSFCSLVLCMFCVLYDTITLSFHCCHTELHLYKSIEWIKILVVFMFNKGIFVC